MMQAVVRYSRKPGSIKVLNVPKPKIKKFEKKAIVRVHAVGICGSDIENFSKVHKKKEIPYILGHEFSGYIHELPKKYSGRLKVKDKVTCETVHSVCDKCKSCKQGNYNLCLKRKMIGGSTMNGAYSKFVKVPIKYIHKLKNNISMDNASIIEPMCVAYNAVIKNSKIDKNKYTIVFGGGAIAIMCLKMLGLYTKKVILICTNKDLKLIRKLKFTKFSKVIPFSNNIEKKVIKITKNVGISLIIDAVGGVKETFETSINLIDPKGQITKVGWVLKKNFFDIDKLIKKNVTFQGSFSHNYPIWEKCINLLHKKKIDISDVITHKFHIRDWKKGFEFSKKRKGIKIILSPSYDR